VEAGVRRRKRRRDRDRKGRGAFVEAKEGAARYIVAQQARRKWCSGGADQEGRKTAAKLFCAGRLSACFQGRQLEYAASGACVLDECGDLAADVAEATGAQLEPGV